MTRTWTRVENENAHQMAHLTNKSGGALATGDVVVPDVDNDNAVDTVAGAATEKVVYVVAYDPSGAGGDDAQSIANDADGWFTTAGIAYDVQIDGAVSRHEWLTTSGTAKKLTGTGDIMGTDDPPVGTVGFALEALGGAGQGNVFLLGSVVTAAGGGDGDVDEPMYIALAGV